MRIFVHDYAGHPFQVDLSRALAKRGHEVTHAYFSGDQGPKGDFANRSDDGDVLHFAAIGIKGGYDKASFVLRRFKDIEYGRNVAARIATDRPDIVISGNTPTEAQVPILNAARGAGASFVYWVQDFYSIAASHLLAKKLSIIGSMIGGYYRWLEHRQFLNSDAIVVITDDFRNLAVDWCGNAQRVFTIENWGPLNEITPQDKTNAWTCSHNLQDVFVFLYSGTLALKHNPQIIIELARKWKNAAEPVKIVVVGGGTGVNTLRQAKAEEALDNLDLLPFQAIEDFSNVLASADVLMAVLERDAGVFSTPSKVLSYLCAQRPILLAAPPNNLATKMVRLQDAGIIVAPDDVAAFLDAADRLYSDEILRQRLALNGRRFAEKAFDIETIVNKFLNVFDFARNARLANLPSSSNQSSFAMTP